MHPTKLEIIEKVELPEKGIAQRIINAIIYGKEGNVYEIKDQHDDDF